MLRFIALSLAVHGLAVGAWYYRETGPEQMPGTRTLALALRLPATSTVDEGVQAPPEPATTETARPASQASPAGQGTMRAPAIPQPAPARGAGQHAPPGSASHRLADSIAAAPETVASEQAIPGTTAMAAAAADSRARQALQSAVSRTLKANFRYPRIARRNGWEGTVMIAMRVMPDGQLADILVSSSSGHPVLDRAALHSLQSTRVPQATQWLSDRAVDLVLPVEYRLLDS